MEILIDPNKLKLNYSGLLVGEEQLLSFDEVGRHLRNRTLRLVLSGITGSGKTHWHKFLEEGLSGIKEARNADNPFVGTKSPVSIQGFKDWEFISVDLIIKKHISRQEIAKKVEEVLKKFSIGSELLQDFNNIWNSGLPDAEKCTAMGSLIQELRSKDLPEGADEMKDEALEDWQERKRLVLNGLEKLKDEENLDLVTLWTYKDEGNQSKYDLLEAEASLRIVSANENGQNLKNRIGIPTGSLNKLSLANIESVNQGSTWAHLFPDDIFASMRQANGKPVGIDPKILSIPTTKENQLFLELLTRARGYILKSHIHLFRDEDLGEGQIRDMVDFVSLVVNKLGDARENHRQVRDRFNAMLRSDPVAEKLREIKEAVEAASPKIRI